MISFIIPTKTHEYAKRCVESIHIWDRISPKRVILVDSGLAGPIPDVEIIPTKLPFVYARAINDGIRAAGTDDVVLLNDDARILSPSVGGIEQAFAADPKLGIISATINHNGVGNPQQSDVFMNQQLAGLVEHTTDLGVCFVAVAIPRRVIDIVGLLDEEFLGYGEEDVDYTWRVRAAGFKTATLRNFRVEHKSSVGNHGGSFRRLPNYHEMALENRAKIRQKWPGKFQ